ncbi:flagellar hook-length control protein FliK [Modestobacter sp. SYSU DS0290]
MTAPMSALPMTPATGRAGSSTGGPATGSAENAAGFASALDDVLHGAGNPSRRPGNGTGGASDGASGEGTGDETPATPVAVPIDVPPGLWALLAAGASLGTTPGTQPETAAAAAALIGAVTGATATGGQPVAVPLPGADPAAGDPDLPLPTAATPVTGPASASVPGTPAALLSALGLVAPAGAQATTAATGTTGADPAVLPADVSVVVVPATAGDTPDAGTETGPGSGGAAPEPDVVGLVGGATAAPVAARTDPLGASGPTAPAAEPPVAQQLGRQLGVLSNAPDGSSTMTLVITPEELGPVSIQVTVADGTLDLTLQGGSDAGRHALTDALPELRRELEAAGLTLGRLAVDATTADLSSTLRSAQQQLLDARAGQQGQLSGQQTSGQQGQPGQPDARPRGWDSPADQHGGAAATPTTDQSTSTGVDVLA